MRRVVPTHIRPTLEYNDILSQALAIRKRTDSLRRLILEAGEELVELLHSEGFEEPFASDQAQVSTQRRLGSAEGGRSICL